MARNKKTQQQIAKITGGLVVTALDLTVLVAAISGGLIVGGFGAHPSRKNSWKVPFIFADWIYSGWSRSKFRQAMRRSMGKGLLDKTTQGYRLTDLGKQRLRELLPSYKKRQTWDERLWLITYDVFESQKNKREILREYLETIGCGMVQKSVWLSIKDPREWLEPKIKTLKLEGSVIISCLGKDGSLGREDVKAMVTRVFKLKPLNKLYQSWIKKATNVTDKNILNLGLEYIWIMEQDPVIPEELLPDDWSGAKAFKLFENKFEPKMGQIGKYLHRSE